MRWFPRPLPAPLGSQRRHWGESGWTHPPGTPPGTLTSPAGAAQPVIKAWGFGPDDYEELESLEDVETLRALCNRWPVTWVNVVGLGDAELVSRIGKTFGLHPLALEDVLNTHQRAKVEPYDDHLFIVSRMAALSASGPQTEQLSMFLGEGFVLSFHERPGDPFDEVRRRIRTPGSRVRASGADYLAYVILDAVVDNYFPLLDHYAERLEDIEEELMAGREEVGVLARIYEIRRELGSVRRAVTPIREALNALIKAPGTLVGDETRVYLRDAMDHALRIIDIVETSRETAVGLTDAYESALSNRMNSVMETLTIIATIFIPLTFVTSLYGMNFDRSSPWNMPELGWRFGYPLVLGLLLVLGVGLYFFFRRRGYLHRRRPRPVLPPRERPGAP